MISECRPSRMSARRTPGRRRVRAVIAVSAISSWRANHFPRWLGHHSGGRLLPGDGGVLGLGGLDDGGRDELGVAHLAVLQPLGEPVLPGPSQSGRGLVAGQQDQGRLRVFVVEGPPRAGKYSTIWARIRLIALVRSAARSRRRVVRIRRSTAISSPQVRRLEIAPHAGLVRDSERVLRVRLASSR